MAKIEIYSNYDLLATLKLESESLTIGRDTTSDICLADDRVSRTHAIVREVDGSHQIENCGMNGTKVNGKAIEEPRTLLAGDSIFISKYILVYEQDSSDPFDVGKTVWVG